MARLREIPIGALLGALAIVVCVAGSAGGCSGGAPDEAVSSEGVPATCGDGICSHDDGEVCENCAADCGECPTCGNGTCELETGLETCESCTEDCGACSICGDGMCVAASGENCTNCADDCGVCEGCGDGTCSDSETCESCAQDCGSCDPCGDGICDATETCDSCADDCGACDACGDSVCDGSEDCDSCSKDCGTCQRKGCVQGEFKAYIGGLHAHTHISDGQGSPLDAFKHASQVAKPPYDFMWLSDHRNGITPAEWKGCVDAANKYNQDGTFVAGCGWEKTVFNESAQGIGHFNMLFPDKLFQPKATIPGIYKSIADCGPCVGQFNHPPWPGTFHDYEFHPVAEDKVRLIEFNGHGSFPDKLKAYLTALDNGWKVSPSWNEDNHHGGWGDTSRATVIWAPELTRQSVKKAVRANRTFATNDETSRLKMMADGVCWMGSKLHGLGASKITMELSDKQAKDGFGPVRLYGPKQKLIAEKKCHGDNPCKVSFPLDVTKRSYVVAVVHQTDGDVIISGPIWYEP